MPPSAPVPAHSPRTRTEALTPPSPRSSPPPPRSTHPSPRNLAGAFRRVGRGGARAAARAGARDAAGRGLAARARGGGRAGAGQGGGGGAHRVQAQGAGAGGVCVYRGGGAGAWDGVRGAGAGGVCVSRPRRWWGCLQSSDAGRRCAGCVGRCAWWCVWGGGGGEGRRAGGRGVQSQGAGCGQGRVREVLGRAVQMQLVQTHELPGAGQGGGGCGGCGNATIAQGQGPRRTSRRCSAPEAFGFHRAT